MISPHTGPDDQISFHGIDSLPCRKTKRNGGKRRGDSGGGREFANTDVFRVDRVDHVVQIRFLLGADERMPVRMVVDQREPKQQPQQAEYPERVEHARPRAGVPHEKAAQLHGRDVAHLRS